LVQNDVNMIRLGEKHKWNFQSQWKRKYHSAGLYQKS